MSRATKKSKAARGKSIAVVCLLSVLSLLMAFLAASLLKPWESASADLRMRWRYHLAPGRIDPDIAFVAVDNRTERELGRFGAGSWLSRRPFSDQLRFFEDYFDPTVLAYDIVIADVQGAFARRRKTRISESPETLKKLAKQLEYVSDNIGELMHVWWLDQLNSFSMDQGNMNLVDRLARIVENKHFCVMIGYYLIGGWVDPQDNVSPWTAYDIYGDDEDGDEESGNTIYYLKDMAIPERDVHFTKGTSKDSYDYSWNGRLPSRELRDYTLLGFVNCPRDQDSVVRRVPLVLGLKYFNDKTGEEKKVFVPSFALTACLLHLGIEFPLSDKSVELFMGKELVIHAPSGLTYRAPIDKKGRLFINFNAKLKDFSQISYIDLAKADYLMSKEERDELAEPFKNRIDGKLTVVGVTESQVDTGAYPLSAEKPTPLVHVHLMAINNILTNTYLAPPGKRASIILWSLLFCMVSVLGILEATARFGPAIFLLTLLYMIVSYVGVHVNWLLLPVIGPSVYMILSAFSILSYRFLGEEQAKRRIRGMFSTMVSDKVLTFLEESPESFSLKGHVTDATVFFSDIEGFTVMSEGLSPDRVTHLLNTYLTPVTNCILEEGGYLDKYVGDEVMAVWGAPYPDSDHALRACRSALRQQEIISELNDGFEKDFGVRLHVRMGINSGRVTAGNMGSEKKFQYTVMGDVVNLASRLEPVNKDFGTSIIIGHETYLDVKGSMEVRTLCKVVVVGKREIVPIYELMGERGKVPKDLLVRARSYEKALGLFHERKWDACMAVLDSEFPPGTDSPADVLRGRIDRCRTEPPESTWCGEYVRQVKY